MKNVEDLYLKIDTLTLKNEDLKNQLKVANQDSQKTIAVLRQ